MNFSPKTGLTLAALASLAMMIAPAAQAQTAPISIFATGVDSTGAVLANGASDSHYTLTTEPTGDSSQLQVLTSAYGFPVVPGGWLGDSSTSAWIAPTNSPFVGTKNGGTYDYQTTFDLTGFNPATASIFGSWATDNLGTDILINGLSTGSTASSSASYSPFSITSGFHTGVNTLDFLVVDDGQGATGLRVDGISGTASPAAVPEASTTVSLGLLLTLGLGGMLAARRKSVKA